MAKRTLQNPDPYNQTKLFPGSSGEFTRWNLVGAVGFVACLDLSFSILGLFRLVRRLAAS